jgi:predicted alpha/beta-hydrolase family hydrolase
LKNPSELTIRPQTGAATTALVYAANVDRGVRPRESPATVSDTRVGATLILAHGAGAGQRSTFMVDFADALSDLGLDVVTFNFPYIEQRRKIPDRAPVLEACYRDVIAAVRGEVQSARRLLCIGG